ncbi:cytosolic phospholipase A2 zeta-like [Clupea harengus]|uniref:Phospholipase A2 n=1 Tax=Clupea harengus TaxID=7950 RepID=A0A8M1KDU6_CLUHA|nr:cytosolic phospholipase A2 zeta-like [Clupea harengus]
MDNILYLAPSHCFSSVSESDCYVILRLPTSSARSHRTQTVPNSRDPEWNETFHFRIHSHVKNVLEMQVYDEDYFTQDDLCSVVLFDISNLTLGQQQTKMFNINEKTNDKLWVEFEMAERPEQELAVRLDFDIPSVEKDFLEKRKVVVGRALHKLLELSSPLQTDKVPLVGVVCSGGGTRAMTGAFGSLKGLQTLGILDAVSYITGVSGATWAMSTLYENADWSQGDLGVVTEPMKVEMIKRYQDILSTERLSYYREEMGQKEKDGLPVSLIDMWGLAIEHLIYGKVLQDTYGATTCTLTKTQNDTILSYTKWDSTLSDQKRAVSEGQNPLPIYTAVNMKTSLKGITEAEWCEFTPYEVGLPKYGAFVPTEDFGSEYFLGHQVKKLPETRLPFMIGIWSSIFSFSLKELWHHVTGSTPSWIGGDVFNTETDNKPSTLDTFLIKPATDTVQMIIGFFTTRPFITQIYNFMRGLYLHWDYNSRSCFTVGQDIHPDAFPNQLTPADPTLDLVDSAFSCNTGVPPVLRPHRRMVLILSLDYSWEADPFLVLKKTQQHCTDHRIPFPHIDFSRVEKEAMKEVYVFEDEKNPKAPIVLHFPLANLTFREFKAPEEHYINAVHVFEGVRREGKDELRMGELDVSSSASPYITENLAYQPEDFQRLMDLTCYNVLNNRDTLLSALRRALQRERVHEDEDEHKDHSCP